LHKREVRGSCKDAIAATGFERAILLRTVGTIDPTNANRSLEGVERFLYDPASSIGDGRHHVEIHRHGFRDFSTDIDVRAGETASLKCESYSGGKE
jgi:hypothetical protein